MSVINEKGHWIDWNPGIPAGESEVLDPRVRNWVPEYPGGAMTEITEFATQPKDMSTIRLCMRNGRSGLSLGETQREELGLTIAPVVNRRRGR